MSGYPKEYSRVWQTQNGTSITIRPIRPEDALIEKAFVHRLSHKSKYYRFLAGLQDLSDSMLRRFTQIDYDLEMALIATVEQGAKETEIAVGRYVPNKDGRSCEFAIVVDDAWQKHGIGYQILSDLIRIAKLRGLKTMAGLIFSVNSEMLELARALGFDIRKVPGDATVLEAVKDL